MEIGLGQERFDRLKRDTMREVYVCDGVRTPIGRYGGSLAKVRTDDLAALPIKALMARNPKADWSKLDDVFYGCANYPQCDFVSWRRPLPQPCPKCRGMLAAANKEWAECLTCHERVRIDRLQAEPA
jgi:ssDNA-binding Zn-finger/Zn-ribbon topoisomerase 1